MVKKTKPLDPRMRISKLNSVRLIVIHKQIPRPLIRMEFPGTKQRVSHLQRILEMMVQFLSQLAVRKRKLSKVQMDFRVHPLQVIHHRTMLGLVEPLAPRHHLVLDRAHLVVKHSAIVVHSINRHLAAAAAAPVVVRKQIHSVVQIILDQLQAQMLAAIHIISIIDLINSYSQNNIKML